MIQKSLIFHEDKTNEIRLQLSVFLDFRELYQTRRQPQRRRPSKQKNCSYKTKRTNNFKSQWINQQRPRSVSNVTESIFPSSRRREHAEK